MSQSSLYPIAASAPAAPLHAMAGHFFTVFASGEMFGIPVDSIQTVFQMEAVTPVPLGPQEILGLVNLRGKIVTAVSLRRRLQLPDSNPGDKTLAVGIEHKGESFALVVDEVGDVIILDAPTQIPLPPHLQPQRARLTTAVYRLEQSILPILDMNAIFDFPRRG